MRRIFGFCLALVALSRAGAQTTETPVPFDSAHRVLVITPALAERLHLADPTWPVRDEYRDVHLYASSTGGFVLVALLPTGSLKRYELTEAQRAALGTAIDAAMATSGRPIGQVGAEPSEPAGNGYARKITALTALGYAPLAASLSDDGSVAGATYVLTTGAAFFISYGAAQSGQITRAQGDLSANLGVAAGAAGLGVGYAATGNGDRGVRAIALGSALAGTIAGIGLGRHLTDAEAHSSTLGIEGTAASAWAVGAAAGAQGRGMAAIVAASEPLGYVIGLQYPRMASYGVTAGDVNAMQTAGLVGALVGGALIGGSHPSPRLTGVALGSSYVAGLLIGDGAIARPFDLTTSDANLVTIGAVAGAVMGLAIPLIAQTDNGSVISGSAAAGATLGMSLVFGSTNFRRAGEIVPVNRSSSRLRIGPGLGVLGLVTRAPGRYPVASFTF
ncbi:MAG TPA: hypothetical protein VGQ44_05645 [Gemmatimonadaceae bacterium]|jgi:hypothetical protein|nr:hypothetical protein [Gemmatimonadaceae bacterium]